MRLQSKVASVLKHIVCVYLSVYLSIDIYIYRPRHNIQSGEY